MDPEHAQAVTAFRRWTNDSMCIRKNFFARLKEITHEDFRNKDEGWVGATIVSTDHQIVHAVNQLMVQQYAKWMGVPLVVWR